MAALLPLRNIKKMVSQDNAAKLLQEMAVLASSVTLLNFKYLLTHCKPVLLIQILSCASFKSCCGIKSRVESDWILAWAV